MKWKDCRKCPKYLCIPQVANTQHSNDHTLIFRTKNIAIWSACSFLENKFKLAVIDSNGYFIHDKFYNTLYDVIEYLLDSEYLDLENLLKLLKFKNKYDI